MSIAEPIAVTMLVRGRLVIFVDDLDRCLPERNFVDEINVKFKGCPLARSCLKVETHPFFACCLVLFP